MDACRPRILVAGTAAIRDTTLLDAASAPRVPTADRGRPGQTGQPRTCNQRQVRRQRQPRASISLCSYYYSTAQIASGMLCPRSHITMSIDLDLSASQSLGAGQGKSKAPLLSDQTPPSLLGTTHYKPMPHSAKLHASPVQRETTGSPIGVHFNLAAISAERSRRAWVRDATPLPGPTRRPWTTRWPGPRGCAIPCRREASCAQGAAARWPTAR